MSVSDSKETKRITKSLSWPHQTHKAQKDERELPESIMDVVNGDDKFGKREFARLLENWAGYVATKSLLEG